MKRLVFLIALVIAVSGCTRDLTPTQIYRVAEGLCENHGGLASGTWEDGSSFQGGTITYRVHCRDGTMKRRRVGWTETE